MSNTQQPAWKEITRPSAIVDRPLWWHLQGLQQTASGYGRKLTTARKIKFADTGKEHRIYCACFSNAGTCYVIIGGERHIVREFDAVLKVK